jgi:hypothetical protein
MKVLFFLLLSHLSLAQTMKLTMEVERVPMSAKVPKSTSQQTVLLILETDRLGIITPTDTLALIKTLTISQPNSNYSVYTYRDEHHNNEMYQGMIVRVRNKFSIFLSPVSRKGYAINLKSL